MKNSTLLKLLIPSLFLISFSCTTDDDNDPTPSTCRATTIVDSNDGTTQVEWSNGNVSKLTIFFGTDSAEEYVYTYNGGTLSRVNKNMGGSLKEYWLTTYSGSNLTQFSQYDSVGTLIGKNVLTYTGGNISSNKNYLYCAGQEYPISIFDYSHSGGNISSITQSVDIGNAFSAAFCSAPLPENMLVVESINYTHDSNNNPAAGVFVPIDIFLTGMLNQNNIQSTAVSGSTTSTNTFIYNSAGFPTRITESTGGVTDITYENCD